MTWGGVDLRCIVGRHQWCAIQGMFDAAPRWWDCNRCETVRWPAEAVSDV